MANMSYCRFENTANALQDCWEHWGDTPESELSSDYERRGKQRLRDLVLEMAETFNIEDDED